MKKIYILVLIFFISTFSLSAISIGSVPTLNYSVNLFPNLSPQLKIFLSLTFLTFLPFIILSVTPFIKVLIILLFLRRAISLPNIPNTTVISSLAFFITMSIVFPLVDSLNKNTVFPFIKGKISFNKVLSEGEKIITKNLINDSDIGLIKYFSKKILRKKYKNINELPFMVLVASYLFNQIKKGFLFGTLIYLPFFIIDIVLAAILISMGIIMLPPTMISTPFKLLVFLSIGGWNFLISKIFEL